MDSTTYQELARQCRIAEELCHTRAARDKARRDGWLDQSPPVSADQLLEQYRDSWRQYASEIRDELVSIGGIDEIRYDGECFYFVLTRATDVQEKYTVIKALMDSWTITCSFAAAARVMSGETKVPGLTIWAK